MTSEVMKYIELINEHSIFNNNSVYIDLSFQISPVIDDDTLRNIIENDDVIKELWDNYGDFDEDDYTGRCVSVYFDRNSSLMDRLHNYEELGKTIYHFASLWEYLQYRYGNIFIYEGYFRVSEDSGASELEFELTDINDMIDFLMGRVVL